jgi:hypothetical protein
MQENSQINIQNKAFFKRNRRLQMQLPTWTKPAVMGGIAGAILTMIVGFNQGGWVLGSTAEKMADQRSAAAVIDALVPVCVSQSKADPAVSAKLAELGAITSTYERRDFVMKAGWATTPATDAPNSDLATACAKVLS